VPQPYRLLKLFGLILAVVFACVSLANAQTDPACPDPNLPITNGGCFYGATGHGVRSPFYDYFVANGGVSRFGYPITKDYPDPQTGVLVQYFENARFEWYPANKEGEKVKLGALGLELGKLDPPIPISQFPSRNDPSCKYFERTRHSLCYNFRDYWEKHSGVALLGLPITEYKIEDGRIVQYFEYAKLEWRPEKTQGERVQLKPIGSAYYTYAGLPPERLGPEDLPFGLRPGETQVTKISARSSVFTPVASRGGSQTAFVFVFDQVNRPLQGVAVTLIVHHPTGAQSYQLPSTQANGVTYYTFPVGQDVEPGGVVYVEFQIDYEGIRTSTRDSYLIWFK